MLQRVNLNEFKFMEVLCIDFRVGGVLEIEKSFINDIKFEFYGKHTRDGCMYFEIIFRISNEFFLNFV